MRVAVLGTMGWMPSDRRETTCLACRDGDLLFVLDAGTGLGRLLSPPHSSLLDGISTVHLFLTHFHLDHVCGLAYLPGVFPGREVVIHAADASVTGVEPEGAVAGLLRKPYNPRDWHDLEGVRVEPLKEGANHVAGRSVQVRPQRHSDVSVAYRVDDDLVLATDTAADTATVKFSRGAALLLHEAWYNAADPRTEDQSARARLGYAAHSEAGEVARLAADAGVGRLVLMHLNPMHDEDYFAALEAASQAVFPGSAILEDGEVVDTLDPV